MSGPYIGDRSYVVGRAPSGPEARSYAAWQSGPIAQQTLATTRGSIARPAKKHWAIGCVYAGICAVPSPSTQSGMRSQTRPIEGTRHDGVRNCAQKVVAVWSMPTTTSCLCLVCVSYHTKKTAERDAKRAIVQSRTQHPSHRVAHLWRRVLHQPHQWLQCLESPSQHAECTQMVSPAADTIVPRQHAVTAASYPGAAKKQNKTNACTWITSGLS